MSRKEYHHQRYLVEREKKLKKQKKYYKDHREERLTYQQNYDILHKEDILAKKKMKSTSFQGHADSIYNAVRKWAKKWGLPICTAEEFYRDWTFNDPKYEQLWEAWKESGYDEFLSPVVMRKVKKNGFVPENLEWDVKNNYSWWNEDSMIFKKSEEELEEQQKVNNRRNKEWRKKVRQQWKDKQKAKHVS